jgi:hypothetical protein
MGTTDGSDVSLGKRELDDPVLWELDDVVGGHEAGRRYTVEDLKESGHIRGRVRGAVDSELAIDELEVEVDLEDIRSFQASSTGSSDVGSTRLEEDEFEVRKLELVGTYDKLALNEAVGQGRWRDVGRLSNGSVGVAKNGRVDATSIGTCGSGVESRVTRYSPDPCMTCQRTSNTSTRHASQ